ncbi:MAG: hypothetical protein ACOCNZ_03000 [Prevotella sp.]
MEEKQKVYIRGCKGRWNEIKDILTGLGATQAECSCDDNFVYFINHHNKITCALIGSEIVNIIMDNYREIELPQQWKEGDILIHDRYPYCYAVFKKYKDNDTFEAYFILDNKDAHFDATASVEHYRLANTKEIKGLPRLFSYLMAYLNDAGLCLPKARYTNKIMT